jgi:hypothetical protein
LRGDPAGEKAQHADDEQHEWYEEEEQTERDRATDDGAGGLLVASVEPFADIEDEPVLVVFEEPARPRRTFVRVLLASRDHSGDAGGWNSRGIGRGGIFRRGERFGIFGHQRYRCLMSHR